MITRIWSVPTLAVLGMAVPASAAVGAPAAPPQALAGGAVEEVRVEPAQGQSGHLEDVAWQVMVVINADSLRQQLLRDVVPGVWAKLGAEARPPSTSPLYRWNNHRLEVTSVEFAAPAGQGSGAPAVIEIRATGGIVVDQEQRVWHWHGLHSGYQWESTGPRRIIGLDYSTRCELTIVPAPLPDQPLRLRVAGGTVAAAPDFAPLRGHHFSWPVAEAVVDTTIRPSEPQRLQLAPWAGFMLSHLTATVIDQRRIELRGAIMPLARDPWARPED